MEQFILLVRQCPCLWDMECREYRDMRKKHSAWKRVVQELKSQDIPDVRTAKAEWKKLRDSHRDALKRARAIGPLGAQPAEYTKVIKWKFADHMEFLLPYMKTRTRGRNLASAVDDDAEDLSLSPSDSFLVVPSTSNVDNVSFSPDHTENDVDTTQEIEHKYRKRKHDDEFEETIIDMEDQSGYTDRGKHPLNSFFESMCETTKQFPTWLQYSVKRKIFNIISEAEDTFESYKSREPVF